MDVRDFVRSYKQASLAAQAVLPEEEITELIARLEAVRDEGGRIFICGNGGSAAMASHMAGELGKDASVGKATRFRALSLTDNVVWISALANDLDYDAVFVEQLRNFARPGDLLIAFSCSGNSGNVLRAVQWARENQVETVGVTGTPGGRLAEMADRVIRVESGHVGHIQEGHFLIQHLLCYRFIDSP